VGLGPGWHGERPGPARCDQEDTREQLAQPTDVMAAQAGQLDHLDDIGPPPASKMRKRSSWEAGEAAFFAGDHA